MRTRESNPAKTAYETVVMRQLNFPAMKTWLPQMESNHLPVGYQPTARPESLAAMDPSGRLELPCQPYQSCGSPSILAGNNYGADGDARNPNLSLTKRAFFLLNYIGESLEPRPRV